jgi:hypothetical protein
MHAVQARLGFDKGNLSTFKHLGGQITSSSAGPQALQLARQLQLAGSSSTARAYAPATNSNSILGHKRKVDRSRVAAEDHYFHDHHTSATNPKYAHRRPTAMLLQSNLDECL